MVAIPVYLGECPELPLGVDQGTRFLFRFYAFDDAAGEEPTDVTDFDGALIEWRIGQWHGGTPIATITTDGSNVVGLITVGTETVDGELLTFLEIDVPGTVTEGWPPGEWVHDFTVYYDDDPANGDRFFRGPVRINGQVKP